MHIRWFSLLTILINAICALPVARAEKSPPEPQIWVSVISLAKPSPQWAGIRTDVTDQWKPDSPWQTVACHAGVAKLSAGNVESTPDANLQALMAEVKRRHLELALEIRPLVRSDDCKPNNEAYGRPGETAAILQRIKQNGGDLRYIAMDEPFYYGHRDWTGCHLPAEQLAQQVAARVVSMRRIFPQLQIGDIEVTGTDREWIRELAQWSDSYRAATGEPLAFLHADLDWSELAMNNLMLLAAELKQQHIPFGVIYNGGGGVNSDLEWAQNAIEHLLKIESVLKIHPDAAIFQTWTRLPTHVLPETQPGTLTNVAFQYLQPASSLRLTRAGAEISGVLTGPDGAPVPNASVTLTALDVGARIGPSPRHLAGAVPPNAATAVIGIRAGLEGSCICAGATGAVVGGIHYKEQGSGKQQQDVSPVHLPIEGAPASFRTLELIPGKTYAPNLKQFPVTAGASYTLDTWIAATAAAENAGYVTIVFLDAAGKEIVRNNIWFTPSTQVLGTLQTDAHGAFRLTLPDLVALAQPEIRASYSGDASLRPALGVLPSSLGAESALLPALEQILSARPSPLTVLGARQIDLNSVFGDATPQPNAKQQWEQVCRQIHMLRLTGGAITAMSDAALARMVRDLSARHVALGLEILATNWYHEPPCGGGVEGYIDPGAANQVVAKLLKAGGTVSLIAMDEPFWFGHFYSGKNACRSSIPDLAGRVATIVKIYTAAFPNMLVGDIEPFPAVSSQPNWESDYAAWVKAFQNATDKPLSFLHLDFDWANPRLNSGPMHGTRDPIAIANLARQVAAVARSNGLLIGMIMNGGGPPQALSDGEWIEQAHTHIRAVIASGLHFDHLLFETWDKYPARTWPASDPNTISGLITFYTQLLRAGQVKASSQ